MPILRPIIAAFLFLQGLFRSARNRILPVHQDTSEERPEASSSPTPGVQSSPAASGYVSASSQPPSEPGTPLRDVTLIHQESPRFSSRTLSTHQRESPHGGRLGEAESRVNKPSWLSIFYSAVNVIMMVSAVASVLFTAQVNTGAITLIAVISVVLLLLFGGLLVFAVDLDKKARV